MRTLMIKAVVACDKEGNYVIHGSNGESPEEMFKAVAGGDNPIWHFDPSKETAHYVEIPVTLPDFEDTAPAPANSGVVDAAIAG